MGLRPLLDAVALLAIVGFRVNSTSATEAQKHAAAVGAALFVVHASTLVDARTQAMRTVVRRDAIAQLAIVFQTTAAFPSLSALINGVNGGASSGQHAQPRIFGSELDLAAFVEWFVAFINVSFFPESTLAPRARAAAVGSESGSASSADAAAKVHVSRHGSVDVNRAGYSASSGGGGVVAEEEAY